MSSNNTLQTISPSPHQQSGLTLIEIMIAMLIGVFLIAGILQLFISSKQSYRVQEALSRLQENGRFAMDFIGRDIRMADYRDCPSDRNTPLSNVKTSGSYMVDAVSGTENTGLNGSDTLNTNSEKLGSTNGCTATPGNAPRNFWIANSFGVPTLFSTTPATGPLIEGVENMQVLYGVDTDATTDGTPNYYIPYSSLVILPATPNINQVVAVRVSLLLRTLDNNLAPRPLAYTYNGTTTTPPVTDLYLRRVFTSTFALRNRLP